MVPFANWLTRSLDQRAKTITKVAAEIGEVLCGRVAPPPAGTTVIFKSLGQAVEDTVAARLVYRAALAQEARA